jgi:hypothetical protein
MVTVTSLYFKKHNGNLLENYGGGEFNNNIF